MSDGSPKARPVETDVTAVRQTHGRGQPRRVSPMAVAGVALLAAAVLFPGVLLAEEMGWKIDGATSRLRFTATVEGAAMSGVFKEFDARVQLDSKRPAEGSLDVTVVMASADMSDPEANRTIKGAEWFDVARYPRAEFHATGIEPTAAGRYLARGILRLKGAQQPVQVPFTWAQTGDVAQMDGELVIRRGDFNIGTGEWAATTVVGPDVKVEFSVRLRSDG